MLLLVQGDWV